MPRMHKRLLSLCLGGRHHFAGNSKPLHLVNPALPLPYLLCVACSHTLPYIPRGQCAAKHVLFRRRNGGAIRQYITVPGGSRWVVEAAVSGRRIVGDPDAALQHRSTAEKGEGGADGKLDDATGDNVLVQLREVSNSGQKAAEW